MKIMKCKTIMHSMAFTFTGVLIVIGMIGIIAEITVPTIMQNIQNQNNIARLRKTYVILSQAYTSIVKENGQPDNWFKAGDGDAVMLKKFLPYFKITKDCSNKEHGCWAPGKHYFGLNGSDDGVYDETPNPSVVLTNGSYISTELWDSTCKTNISNNNNSPTLETICGAFVIDLNGAKTPNRWGKDVFEFLLTNHGIIPSGTAGQYSSWSFETDCGDSITAFGEACAAWVIYNRNEDYLKCSGLSWNGKHSCS